MVNNNYIIINVTYNFYILDFWKIVEKFDIEEASFNFLVKRGVNSKVNKESTIALYLPDNSFQRIHYYEFPVIKELKWRNGAKTKYEIPQYINDIPEDYPVFCTIKEAGMIKNIQNKLKKKEEKRKVKSSIKSKDKDKDKEKDKNNDKENISSKSNNNNNVLDEPIPNEMHKYCHLCKKHFDNYLRHINSKIHKDNTNKYAPKFHNIKNIFKRINTFWDNKKENNENKNKQEDDNNNNSIINDEVNLDDDSYKLKIFSQFNQNVKEGCKAKKKILLGNSSQLSTAQSFPIIPPKKRKKNEIKNKSKSKKNKSNKTINEFLIQGNFVNIKKINRDNIHFYNNYYN